MLDLGWEWRSRSREGQLPPWSWKKQESFSPGASGGITALPTLGFQPIDTDVGCQASKIVRIHFCCLKPTSLWFFVITAMETSRLISRPSHWMHPLPGMTFHQVSALLAPQILCLHSNIYNLREAISTLFKIHITHSHTYTHILDVPSPWTFFITLFHWKRPWCWERLRAEEGDNRGWDGWMASPTQWTWVWVNSGRQWRTGKPGVLQSMGSKRAQLSD